MNYTKGEWHACGDGKCPCKQVWSDNYPVAQILCGKWGDDYPSIRIIGDSSLDLKAEAYMEQITYGEIPEKVARANAHLIAAAPDMYEALKMLPEQIQWIPEVAQALAKAEGGEV